MEESCTYERNILCLFCVKILRVKYSLCLPDTMYSEVLPIET